MANKFPARGSYHLRKGRCSESGNLYFITTSTFNGEPTFRNESMAHTVFDSLYWLEENKRIELICCIVMPNHIHMIIQLGENQTLSGVMNSFKGFTGKKISELKNQGKPVWQKQYYEHCIRKDEDLNEIICYCYENPVRSGLVNQAKEYPFWKCKFELG